MAIIETDIQPRRPLPESDAAHTATDEITYPERDGQPMADHTKQFRYIVTIYGGLAVQFAGDPDVFVAGDLLWYPVEGNNRLRTAPDVMVVFGRPKGDRGSCIQWREENIAPQVVFEILPPGNTPLEMIRKYAFYEQHGVEEYYVYDPDYGQLAGWRRDATQLVEIDSMGGGPARASACVSRSRMVNSS